MSDATKSERTVTLIPGGRVRVFLGDYWRLGTFVRCEPAEVGHAPDAVVKLDNDEPRAYALARVEPTTQVTVGPFIWTRNDRKDGDEQWELEDAVKLIGCIWSLTNYGEPQYKASAFSGWRCGSGGPWPERYASRDDAMTRVIPYLIYRMRERMRRAEQLRQDRIAAFNEACAWYERQGLDVPTYDASGEDDDD